MATDGVWEMHDSGGEMFGKQRFRDVIRHNATRSAGEISQAIIHALESYRGGKPAADDVTLVVMKLTATPSDKISLEFAPNAIHTPASVSQ